MAREAQTRVRAHADHTHTHAHARTHAHTQTDTHTYTHTTHTRAHTVSSRIQPTRKLLSANTCAKSHGKRSTSTIPNEWQNNHKQMAE
jgi:hypothetical protein